LKSGDATRRCSGDYREAAKFAGAQLLERMMAVKMVTPEERLGTAIDDLNSRRDQVLSLNERAHRRSSMHTRC
jgi:elongation factor G